MKVARYQDLAVWQKSMDLVVNRYRATDGFPKSELFGLTSQIRRAAVSIPANVAEGFGRQGTPEFLHFLSVAYGSLLELETHLQIAARLEFLQSDRAAAGLSACAEIGRMINGLSSALARRDAENNSRKGPRNRGAKSQSSED